MIEGQLTLKGALALLMTDGAASVIAAHGMGRATTGVLASMHDALKENDGPQAKTFCRWFEGKYPQHERRLPGKARPRVGDVTVRSVRRRERKNAEPWPCATVYLGTLEGLGGEVEISYESPTRIVIEVPLAT